MAEEIFIVGSNATVIIGIAALYYKQGKLDAKMDHVHACIEDLKKYK